jgi:predicted ATPase
MLHLKSIVIRKWPSQSNAEFPFNLKIVKSLKEIEFTSDVTFFVGENGSGKSTLLEAIACAVGAIAVGSDNLGKDKTLSAVRKLAQHFKLSWQIRTHKGFFLRAEDFFGFAKRMAQMREDMENDLKAIDEEYRD